MTFRSVSLFTALLASAFASQLPAQSTGPLAPVLQASIDQKIVAGAVVLVADKDKVLDLEAAGNATLEPKRAMQIDDLFWIASMTKSFTGAAFEMLVDEGKVDINDPVEKYLPEFKGQKVAEGGDLSKAHSPQHPITIREVLSHTSGLVLANDKSLKHTNTLKGEVEAYAAAPLRQEPGTKFEYNNCGINTAGRIIEVVSGMSYVDFMQTRLLDPLGLKHTTFWPNEEQAKHLADSFRQNQDKTGLEGNHFDKNLNPAAIEKFASGVPVPGPIVANFGGGILPDYGKHYGQPAGGLFSTAEDVGKFCQMLLNGGEWQGKRYLSEKAIHQIGSIQTGEVAVNPVEGYGLGWFVKKKEDESLQPGSFGHRGARKTVMWVDPSQCLAIVLLVQSMDMTGPQQKMLYGSVFKAAVEKYGKPSHKS